MEMEQLWIEPVGNIINARVRGVPSESLLKECQDRILTLVRDLGQGRILYDCLEMDAPSVEVPLSQWKLDKQVNASIRLRRAVLVPNTKLAYLARIAFGEEVRVFYNDMATALEWLTAET